MRFPRLHIQRKFQRTMPPADSRARWNNYLHLLREVVHLHCAWIPRTESIDVKMLLGIHLYEDALFVSRIRQRLEEFGMTDTQVLQPCAKIRVILDTLSGCATWEEYIGSVYNVLKPFLIDAWETHFTTTDALLDEPSTRLLADLLRVTSQHINGGMVLIESLLMEYPEHGPRLHEATARMRDVLSTLGPEPTQLASEVNPRWSHAVKNGLHSPAREPFVVLADPEFPAPAAQPLARKLHDHVNLRIQAAELLAVTLHENPRAPWFAHEAVTRQVWDLVRHVRILESLLGTLEADWGHFPVSLRLFDELYALGPKDRLTRLAVERHRAAQDLLYVLKEFETSGPDTPGLSQTIEFFRADDEWHHARRVHWAW